MAFPYDRNREGRGDLSTVIEGYLAAAGTEQGRRAGARSDRELRRMLLRIDAAVGEVGADVLERGDATELDRLARRVLRDARHAPSHAAVMATLGALSQYAAGRVAPMAAPPGTPTGTMLALGAQMSVWFERIVVVAFVLVAIGLAFALA